MYVIKGRYRGTTEELDSADSLEEALYLVANYVQAFGRDWLVWYEEV